MKVWSACGRLVSGIAVAAILGACALAPESASETDSFPIQAATETLTVGYTTISEKFIEPIKVEELAVEGMRGLGSLDPALTIHREGRAVVLDSSTVEVARFDAPETDDPQAWAALTVDLSRAGRSVSSELRKASIEDIYEAVFDGALSRLDRFSRYAGREEAKRNRARREGFGGIGIRFQVRDTGIVVTEVMEETPAEEAGLEVGDLIVAVDGSPVLGLTSSQVVQILRGPVDTNVTLDVRRDGESKSKAFTMARGHVVPTSVRDSFKDGVLVLEISRFNQATTHNLSRKTKAAFREHGANLRGIVLDLRGNPGGLLKQAIRAADLFLTQGEILRTHGRHPDSLQFYEAGGADVAQGVPLIVLIDGKSASAAEITAAALQDRERAVVIGTTSFGKGSVQTVVRLPNEGEITLTWSRFVMPSGYILHELGVHPTICTSGSHTDGDDPILSALSDREHEAKLLATWRAIASGDDAQRRDLRALCPAERRDDDYELKLAQRLLAQPKLYARLLGLSNRAAAAVQP